jgi:hypothetical protein
MSHNHQNHNFPYKCTWFSSNAQSLVFHHLCRKFHANLWGLCNLAFLLYCFEYLCKLLPNDFWGPYHEIFPKFSKPSLMQVNIGDKLCLH